MSSISVSVNEPEAKRTARTGTLPSYLQHPSLAKRTAKHGPGHPPAVEVWHLRALCLRSA